MKLPAVVFTSIEAKFLGDHLQFRLKTKLEFIKDAIRLGLVAPREVTGFETGYSRKEKEYEVVAWTSFVRSAGAFRQIDCGRVLILKGDDIIYCSPKIYRTKNFEKNLTSQAYVQLVRIHPVYRPVCPDCGALMTIANKKYHRYWWECRRVESHKESKVITRHWDTPLVGRPKALAYVELLRRRREAYRKKRKKQGKPAYKSHQKGWEVTKKGNKI